MSICVFTVSDIHVYAATSVPDAKKAYKRALASEKQAKDTYEKASIEYKKGAFGFYQWIIDNYDGWMEEDAKEALKLLDITSYKEYTVQGNEQDATDLNNMKRAIELLPTLAKDRANDEFHPGLQPPTIRNVYMARAQVNSNVSSYTHKHTYNDPGCAQENGSELGESGEDLAWGYYDPFDGWYEKEKKNFIAKRDYTLEKYGVDINTTDWDKYIYRDDFDYNAYIKETEQFGETGHYHLVCAGRYEDIHLSYEGEVTSVDRYMRDIVFFGLGFSEYGWCHSLVESSDDYKEGYSVDEYTKLFNSYYNQVNPETEKSAYDKAKKASAAKLRALKKAARPSKPTVKRKGKKVTVKWKKIKGVDGYQISIAKGKGKTKIVSTISRKKAKKAVRTITTKSKAKQYVKIRSYVIVNGKKVYSNWSKARRI